MAKEHVDWEPDIKKATDLQKNMEELKEKLKADADKRKIDGFNPGDLANQK
ncbi:MAG: hypothetical protein ACYSWZ_11935 [Planctomycetota bacterium]|jgi:hypothetical protein